jgi:hypothetical protein
MRACALYIGNDSGPKHIAAALGVPTVGIHSGVVDATEWAPMGRRAVALRRNMSCAPCYLQHATDCPRNLACLRFLEPALVHQTAQMLLARPVSQQVPIRRQSADEPEPVEAAITVVSTPTVAVRPRTVKAKTARRSQVKRARA